MTLPIDLLLALRYLRPKRTFISIISLLSVLGPLLGVAILIIVTSIMAGFDHDIRRGIMDMQAHITFYPTHVSGRFAEPDDLIQQLEKAMPELGLKAAPVIEGTVLLQVKDQVYPKMIRGIIPHQESRITRIQQNFSRKGVELQPGQAAIGNTLAWNLGLAVGDQFIIHSPARLTGNVKWLPNGQVEVAQSSEIYMPAQCKVATYYTMGLNDFDANIVVVHMDQAAEMFGYDWGEATSIQAVVDKPMSIHTAVDELRRKFPQCQIVTWQEKNQLLFNTLQSEKNLMTFLMAFIVLVASFTISATLITVVVQKTREIGIMKAVGVPSSTIARIFLLQGTIIGTIGTILGTITGLTVIYFRDQIANLLSMIMGVDVFPAELYHLTSIPALTTGSDLTRILLMSMTICIVAALVPALYASAFSPAQSLRSGD